jgi:hypothetical protein
MDASRAADWAACFHDFAVHRKPNADAIADLALENFEEVGHMYIIYATNSHTRLKILITLFFLRCVTASPTVPSFCKSALRVASRTQ